MPHFWVAYWVGYLCVVRVSASFFAGLLGRATCRALGCSLGFSSAGTSSHHL